MSVNVKLKDEIGQFRVYEDVDTITVNTDEEGVLATFYLNRGFDTPERRHNNILKMKQDLDPAYYTSVTWQDETDQTIELISFRVSGVGTWLITPTNAICLDAQLYFRDLANYANIVVCYNSSTPTSNVPTAGESFGSPPHIFYKVSYTLQSLQYSWTDPESGITYTATPSQVQRYDGRIFVYFSTASSPGTYIAIYNEAGVLLTHWFWAENVYGAQPIIPETSSYFQFGTITKMSDNVYIFHAGPSSYSSLYTLSVNLNTGLWHLSNRYVNSSQFATYRPLNATMGIIGYGYSSATSYQDYIVLVNRLTGEFSATTSTYYPPNLYWSGNDTTTYQWPWPFFFETETHWFLTGMYSIGDTSSNVGKSISCLLKINKTTMDLQHLGMPAGAMQSFYFDAASSRLFYVAYNDHKLHVLNITDLTETTHNLHGSGTHYYIRHTSRGVLIHSCSQAYTGSMENVLAYQTFKDKRTSIDGLEDYYVASTTTHRPNWPNNNTYISANVTDTAYGAYFFDLVTNTFHTIIDKQFMFNVCTEVGNCLVLANNYCTGTTYNAAGAGFYYFDQVTHTVYQPAEAFRYSDYRNMGYWWHLPLGRYIVVGGGYRAYWNSGPGSYYGNGIFIIDTESMTYTFYESPVSGTTPYTGDTFYYWCVAADNSLWFRPRASIRTTSVWRIKDGVMTEYTGLLDSSIIFMCSFTHAGKTYVHVERLYELINNQLIPVLEAETNSAVYLSNGQRVYQYGRECFDSSFVADYYGLYGTATGDSMQRVAWQQLFTLVANNATLFVPVYYINGTSTSTAQVIGYTFDDTSCTRVNIRHSTAPLHQAVYQNNSAHKIFMIGANSYNYSGFLAIDTASGEMEWVAQGTYDVEKPNTMAKATYETAGDGSGVWIYYPAIAHFVKWYYDFITGELTRFTWEDEEPTIELAITVQPEDYVGQIGDEVSFTVEAVGEVLRYQWQYSSDSGTTWGNSSLPGNNTATLSTTFTEARLAYVFRCVVTDGYGNSVTSDTVRMIEELAIIVQPVNYVGQIGDAVSFTVVATGSELTYQWQYSSDAGVTWGNSSLPGNQTATLTTEFTTARKVYRFRCVVTDGNGDSVISNTVRMIEG